MSNPHMMNVTDKSRVRRAVKRARYDKRDVYQLVDDVKLAHVGFTQEGQVIIIPITLWRVEDNLYFHVANKSRLQKLLESGQQVCVSIAENSEWVLSKSAFHHSTNYRSAVLFCSGERVLQVEEFDHAFKVIINQIEPDRWDKVRPPTVHERKGTALMRLTIEEGSFKTRTGGPNEDEEDLHLPVHNGTIPVCPMHRR